MSTDRFNETVAAIRAHTGVKPRIGLILGSGLGSFVDHIQVEKIIPYDQIPHFYVPSIEGHKGRLVVGTVDGIPIAALQGRLHYYEGYSMAEIVYPTRTLAMLGIEAMVLTNAAGGIKHSMRAGDFMIIEDHINMMGDNPLKGRNSEQFGPRFPDMTEAYDRDFVKIASRIAKKQKLRASKGIYVAMQGPTYETPAEVRHIAKIGGDAVGMSTVPESIAANHFGLRVCGISCITNLAAGISDHKLSHADVTETAKLVETKFARFMSELIPTLGAALDGSSKKSKASP